MNVLEMVMFLNELNSVAQVHKFYLLPHEKWNNGQIAFMTNDNNECDYCLVWANQSGWSIQIDGWSSVEGGAHSYDIPIPFKMMSAVEELLKKYGVKK